jgi:hypothetical protein
VLTPDEAVTTPISELAVPATATTALRSPATEIDENDPLVKVTESAIPERTPPITTTDKPTEVSEFSISNGIEHVDKQTPVCASAAAKVSKSADATPTVLVADTHPTCLAFAWVTFVTAAPVVEATSEIITSLLDALATGDDATDRNPAVSVVTATSAMRCFIVLLDIYFLSLVKLGNFPISARRSFDLLILFPYGTHV